jgi:hypothetical protein
MQIIRLNSFDEVAACYEKTPVLKSKDHTVDQDIRPIGKRRRKWERIIKISKNCYALSCGGNADPVFNWGWRESVKKHPLTPKETERLSPIVWRKHRDGTETVTVRNGQGSWQHNAVYSFLSRALPRELWFRINRQGRQAIYNRSEGKEYYLPKTKTMPRYLYEHYKQQVVTHKASNWAKKRFAECSLHFDNLSITFKRKENGTFELAGEAPKEMVKRTRVDKVAKKEFKPFVNEVYAWSTTMYPLMRDQLNYTLRNDTVTELDKMATEKKIAGWQRSWSSIFSECDHTLIRRILKDPEHPMRYALGLDAMYVIAAATTPGWRIEEHSDEEAQTRARASFNKWINKLAGFVSTVKEEK